MKFLKYLEKLLNANVQSCNISANSSIVLLKHKSAYYVAKCEGNLRQLEVKNIEIKFYENFSDAMNNYKFKKES